MMPPDLAGAYVLWLFANITIAGMLAVAAPSMLMGRTYQLPSRAEYVALACVEIVACGTIVGNAVLLVRVVNMALGIS